MYYSFLAKILRERTPTLEIIKLEPQLGVVYVSHNKMNYYVLESLIQTLEYLWFFFFNLNYNLQCGTLSPSKKTEFNSVGVVGLFLSPALRITIY